MPRAGFHQERPSNSLFRCANCGQGFATNEDLLEHEVGCRPGSGRGSQIPRPAREWQEQPDQTL